jgi:hypothetical protein
VSLWRTVSAVRATLLVVAGLSVLSVACGDDGGDSSAAGRGGAGDPTREGSDRVQIAETLRYLRHEYNAGHAGAVCSKLTAAGQRGFVEAGGLVGRFDTCVEAVRGLQAIARETRIQLEPVEIVSMKIGAGSGSATVRSTGGFAGPRPIAMRFAKDAGEWKLADPGFPVPR